MIDESVDGAARKRNLLSGEPVRFQLLRNEILLRNLCLFFFCVAGNRNHFHPVQKRPGDRVDRVGRRDEHDAAQVEGNLQVVIHEFLVLFGVEHFEQRRSRVAAKICTDLIDFVEQKHRIVRAAFLDSAHDPSRYRTDVRSPVPADFRFVAHAAERHVCKLAVHRPRNRTRNRRFPDAGRPYQAQNRTLLNFDKRQHSQILQDAFLDFIQSVMVFFENGVRRLDIDVALGGFVPGQIQDPFHIRADDARLRHVRGHFREAPDFLFDLLRHLLGQFQLA